MNQPGSPPGRGLVHNLLRGRLGLGARIVLGINKGDSCESIYDSEERDSTDNDSADYDSRDGNEDEDSESSQDIIDLTSYEKRAVLFKIKPPSFPTNISNDMARLAFDTTVRSGEKEGHLIDVILDALNVEENTSVPPNIGAIYKTPPNSTWAGMEFVVVMSDEPVDDEAILQPFDMDRLLGNNTHIYMCPNLTAAINCACNNDTIDLVVRQSNSAGNICIFRSPDV